jgi:hypothetical protein
MDRTFGIIVVKAGPSRIPILDLPSFHIGQVDPTFIPMTCPFLFFEGISPMPEMTKHEFANLLFKLEVSES